MPTHRGATAGIVTVLAVVAMIVTAGTAPAWWVKGHGTIAEAAATGLPEGVPAFFRAAGKALNHLAGDPDRFKNREARFLKVTESPDHYIDLEYYEGHELPPDRFQAIALLKRIGQAPDKAGLLPYALMEHYDRLTVAFYDHRQDPANEAIRMKCIVYAGVLSHYTGDCCMPLHTTKDYDGRAGLDGVMRQKGIHAKIDGFPELNDFQAAEVGRDLVAREIPDIWRHVQATIRESHAHIEKCYDLDLQDAFAKPTAESRAFIMARCRAAAQFTLDLWYNAWLKSERLPKHY